MEVQKLPEHVCCVVQTEEDKARMLSFLQEEKRFLTFDLETEGLDWWREGTRIVGCGFGVFKDGKVYTFYLPILATGIPPDLLAILSSPVVKVGANIKFDCHWVSAKHKTAVFPLHDIQVMARLLRTAAKSVSLDSLMDLEYSAPHSEWEELQAWARQHKYKCNERYVDPRLYTDAPVDLLGRYCCADVYWTTLLFLQYSFEIKKKPKLLALYNAIEKPLLSTVIGVEETGIKVDLEYLEGLSKRLEAGIGEAKNKCFELVGKAFDLSSVPQLREIFIARGIKPENRVRKKVDKEGNQVKVETPSFDEACISKYGGKDPFITELLKYKYFLKLKSTYVDRLLSRKSKFIYTSLNQETARTGRFGCKDPPLQTLPRESADLKDFSIRRAIVPRVNSAILSVDLKQIEYCLLAHFSNDPALIEIFKSKQDFHAAVASKLFDVGIDSISKEQRNVAKTFNFAQLYGSGLDNLALKTGIPIKKCKQLVNQYASTFRGVADFKELVYSRCVEQQGVRNPFGRFRHIPRDMARIAVNTLIQGTAADMLKIAMIRVHKLLASMRSRILFPVHDELDINWHFLDGDIIEPVVKCMTEFSVGDKPMFRVPIEADASICYDNWANKSEPDLQKLGDIHFFKGKRQEELLGNIPHSLAGVVRGLDLPDKEAIELICNIQDDLERGLAESETLERLGVLYGVSKVHGQHASEEW